METMDSNIMNMFVPFVSAIIGGIITGCFAIYGVILNHKKDVERQKQNQKDTLNSLYQALYTEIETIWKAYTSNLGAEIEKIKDGEALDRYYPFTSEAFPVYKANLPLIGQIPDTELRKLIVKTYAEGQGIIDSILLNNNYVAKTEQWNLMYHKTGDPFYQTLLEAETKCAVDYAKTIKKQHNNVRADVTNLLESLKKCTKQ